MFLCLISVAEPEPTGAATFRVEPEPRAVAAFFIAAPAAYFWQAKKESLNVVTIYNGKCDLKKRLALPVLIHFLRAQNQKC